LIVRSTRARNVFAQNAYNPRVDTQLRVRAKAEDLLERLTFQCADGKTTLNVMTSSRSTWAIALMHPCAFSRERPMRKFPHGGAGHWWRRTARLAVTSRYASMMAQPMNSTPLPRRRQSVQAKANAAADALAGASISGETSLMIRPVSRRELQARVRERFHG
jgi:hypothetical protein